MVVACLAAMIGCTVGTCEVAKTVEYFVAAPIAAAQVYGSKPAPLKLVKPPNPFQQATGTRASNSISSARRASVSVLGQSAFRTPSIVVIAHPPLKLLENVPSLSLRSLNSGLVLHRGSCALLPMLIQLPPSNPALESTPSSRAASSGVAGIIGSRCSWGSSSPIRFIMYFGGVGLVSV